MSNVAELNNAGKKYKLYFGMFAQEEFNRLSISQGEGAQLSSVATTNVIYAGIFNHALNENKPSPKYAEVAEMVAELFDTDEGMQQIADLLNIYNDSRFGRGVAKQTETIKKKLAEVESQSSQIGEPSEKWPMENLG